METDRPVAMPEDEVQFRLAQLLLLLDALAGQELPGATLERMGYYDFLSANPFLVVNAESRDASLLRLAGFDPRTLSYASSGQRFTSRRERIQHDLSLLVAYGCCHVTAEEGNLLYAITGHGRHVSSQLTTAYAASFSTAANMIVGKLKRLSDAKLRRESATWLRLDSGHNPGAALAHLLGAANRPLSSVAPLWVEVE